MEYKRRLMLSAWTAVCLLLLVIFYMLASGLSDSASSVSVAPSSNAIIQLMGLSIFIVSLTTSIAIATICYRILRPGSSNPAPPRDTAPLLTLTIALFGILITGVFVITTFRVDESARQVASAAADQALSDEILNERIDAQLPAAIDKELIAVLPETVRAALDGPLEELLPVVVHELIVRVQNDAIAMAVARSVSARAAELGDLPVAAELRGEFSQRVQVPFGGESWLSFTLRTEGTYSIRTESSDRFDPFIYVYEASGGSLRLMRVDDNGGNDFNARLDLELRANVTYYIQVQGNTGSSGGCNVVVAQI